MESNDFNSNTLEEIIRNALFPKEISVLDRGLEILGINLSDIFSQSDQLFSKSENPELKPNQLPRVIEKLKIKEKLDSLPENQIYILEEFIDLILKIPEIYQNYLLELERPDLAKDYAKASLDNIKEIYNRSKGKEPYEEIENYILTRKENIIKLEEKDRRFNENKIKLIWNKEDVLLDKISLVLNQNNITANPDDFALVFREYKICKIKCEKVNLFTLLALQFIKEEPPFITCGYKTSRGVIANLDRFFQDDSKSTSQKISFRNRQNRVLSSPHYKEIKEQVREFMSLLK